MPPWTPEYAITDDLARSLIEAQFPQFAPVTIRLLGVGWDNSALLINDEFVFRFPRRTPGAVCLEAETRVLPGLAPLLPLPVPFPTLVGEPALGYPWLFAGYRKVPGRTACAAALDERARQEMAAPLAHFLATLHSIGPDAARSLGAPPDTWNRFDLGRKIPHTRDRLAEMVKAGLIHDPAPWLDLVEDAATTRAAHPSSLVHGDFYVRHLLVDADSRLCGVIDWGDVHIGDPAVDLAVAPGFLPPSAHAAFRRAYGRPIDNETWRLARFHALYIGAILAVYGHSISDADLVREALTMLDHVIA